MCGIAGIFNPKKTTDLDLASVARELLLSIEPRGPHATGLAYHAEGTTMIAKSDINATRFVNRCPVLADGFAENPRSILLHTRWATQGSPTNNQNNHPIYSKVTGLTLIHNGWLTNEKYLIAKYNLEKDAEVDSETVLRLIEHFIVNEKKRVTTAIKLAMNELDGRFACALISEKYPDTLWLWKRGNPLAGVRDEKTGSFIFASTPELLEKALRRCGIYAAKIGELKERQIICLKAIKGKLHGDFKKMRKHDAAPKRRPQKPIINQTPLIGMPKRDSTYHDAYCRGAHDSFGRCKPCCPKCGREGYQRNHCEHCSRKPTVFCPKCGAEGIRFGSSIGLRCSSSRCDHRFFEREGKVLGGWDLWKEQGRKIAAMITEGDIAEAAKAKKDNRLN